MLIRKRSGRTISSKLIRLHAKSANINNYHKLSQDATRRLREHAWKKYRKAKKNATKNREQFLERSSRIMEDKGYLDAANRIRVIGRREPLQESHREIRNKLKPRSEAGILHI